MRVRANRWLILMPLLFSVTTGCQTSSTSSAFERKPQTAESAGQAFCSGIEDKLEMQFQTYEAARSKLLQRVNDGKTPVQRTDWNQFLNLQGSCAWSPADLEALRKKQNEAEGSAKAEARRASVIDLQKLRTQPARVEKFCAELPKGGMLHEHANGTMNRQTAISILEKINPLINSSYMLEKAKDPNVELYPEEMAWLEKFAAAPKRRYKDLSSDEQTKFVDLFFLPKSPYDHSFKRFSYPFLIFPLLRDKSKPELDPDYLQLVDFLKRVHSMGIRYVELTKGVKLDGDSMARLHEMAESLHKETGVLVRWNFAFFRNAEASKNGELAHQLLQTLEQKPSKEIVGIDLLANEETAPALEAGQLSYAPVLAAALGQSSQYRTQLRRTFHAGELGLSENVRDALILGAERVGHGVRLNNDPVTLEYARRLKLGVEVSPVSNLRLRVVRNLSEHPFLRFLRLGLKVSLSTDDEGVLETDMNNECQLVVNQTDIEYVELKQMAYNSIETSFASVEQKQNLLKWLDDSYTKFEQAWR